MSGCRTCDLPDENSSENENIKPCIEEVDNSDCVGTSGEDLGETVTPGDGNDSGCVPLGNSLICPIDEVCSLFDLSESPEACLMDSLIQEQLDIGGAPINVHRLLGVHEQTEIQDTAGTGFSISGGDLLNTPSSNAFNRLPSVWRSAQTGTAVVGSSFVGYDFGPIRLNNGRERYGIETYIKRDISMMRIQQSCNKVNRITKARVERSNDGHKWYGAAIVNVEDCDGLVEISFTRSVPSRWWRIRPLNFNGGPDDYWEVVSLVFIDFESTSIRNIQDKIFLENRDRDYDENSILIKGQYTPLDVRTFVNKWGSSFQQDAYAIEVSFSKTVSLLGRPFVIGDILQIPSETQYTPSLRPVLKYLEVTDVGWAATGFTPTWQPLIQKIVAQPLVASQETQDIMGKMTPDYDSTGLSDIDDGRNQKYQDMADITQTIKAKANTRVPQRGSDTANQTALSDDFKEWAERKGIKPKFDKRPGMLNFTDGMPPNGASYTESDDFPTSPAPVDGQYHRLTYTNIARGIPPRLYRFSKTKGRWIYLETDRRSSIKDTKEFVQGYIDDEINTNSSRPEDIDDKLMGG